MALRASRGFDGGLDVRTNIREFTRGLNSVQRDQLPFALSLAMNRTINGVEADNKRYMARAIDRPTRFTLNSQRKVYSNKRSLNAAIGFREFAGKGVAAGKYLRGPVFGGGRRTKKFEVAMRRRGLLAGGKFVVPAPGVRLNAYGNLTGRRYQQILSDLQAHGEVGYQANRTARSTARNRNYRVRRYFVPKPGGRLRDGVWERSGASGRIKPVLIAIGSPRYRRTFNFFGASARSASGRFRRELPRALERAMATARR